MDADADADTREFGTLRRLGLRRIWPREAADFTPWLADHLAALGEAVGMDLELQAREASVGDFSLDLLARDLGRNRPVVIENQLASTDHDHLGKLLTYAAGLDAGAIVWIAHEFREEHRQTLDWLNQHTDESIDFFGVIIELLQIDDSRPAYNFRLVAFPNEWRKRNIASGAAPASPRGEAYRAFFQVLIDRLRERYKFTGLRAAPPANWVSFASGVTGLIYGANFPQGDRVRVELYIDRGDADLNKRIFDALFADKARIEAEFGAPLSWERLDERRASRVAVYRAGNIEATPQQLDEIRQWMIDQLLHMKKVFGPHVAQVL